MRQEYEKAITAHRVELARDLPLIPIVERLRSKFILTQYDADQIKESNKCGFEQKILLLDILTRKQDDAFLAFCDALEEFGAFHLATPLRQHAMRLVDEMLQAQVNLASLSNSNGSIIKRPRMTVGNEQAIVTNYTIHPAIRSTGSLQNCARNEPNAQIDITTHFKQLYQNKLRSFNPFSLPFKFDIESTWISLGLRRENDGSDGNKTEKFIRMEDHCELIKEAFKFDSKLLLIEGRAATGKTALMRRIAYDWSQGKLEEYCLVLLVEFRHLPSRIYQTVAELVFSGIQLWAVNFTAHILELLGKLLFSLTQSQNCRLLILLDGYDEARPEHPCTELTNYLNSSQLFISLPFDVIITTRPGPLAEYNERTRLRFADVLGFDRVEQRHRYVRAHFSNNNKDEVAVVINLLKKNKKLNQLAKTPLFLTFICLVHEYIKDGTIFKLYCCIIRWLLNRYQHEHPERNIPKLFGCNDEILVAATQRKLTKSTVIHKHYCDFTVLRIVGCLALDTCEDFIFSRNVIEKFNLIEDVFSCGIILREEIRDGDGMETRYLFPHRTVQEFLAGGCFYFWSHYPETSASIENFKYLHKYKDFQRFLVDSLITFSKNRSSELNHFAQTISGLYIRLPANSKLDYYCKILSKVTESCTNLKKILVTEFGSFRLQALPSLMKNAIAQNASAETVDVEFLSHAHNSMLPPPTPSRSDVVEITFEGIEFPSSTVFSSTIKTLKESLREKATLKLENVKVTMVETEGLKSIAEIYTDSHLLSLFVSNDDTKQSFTTEISFVLNYLACLKSARFNQDAECHVTHWCTSLPLQLNCLKFLESIYFSSMSIKSEETFSKFRLQASPVLQNDVKESESCFVANRTFFPRTKNILREISLYYLHFSSSEIYCSTIMTLRKNLADEVTLTLSRVTLELCKCEGLESIQQIYTDSHLLSSFVLKDDATKQYFSTEISFVLNYLACLKRAIFYQNKDCQISDCHKSILPLLFSLKYVEKVTFGYLRIESEENFHHVNIGIETAEEQKEAAKTTAARFTFWSCKFKSKNNLLCLLWNYFNGNFRYFGSKISFEDCIVSLSATAELTFSSNYIVKTGSDLTEKWLDRMLAKESDHSHPADWK